MSTNRMAPNELLSLARDAPALTGLTGLTRLAVATAAELAGLAAKTATPAAAAGQHHDASARAFQLLSLLRLEGGRHGGEGSGSEHGHVGLDFGHDVRFLAHGFVVEFLGQNGLHQFLLRGAKVLIELLEFVAVELGGVAIEFALLFIESNSAETAATKATATRTARTAKAAGTPRPPDT